MSEQSKIKISTEKTLPTGRVFYLYHETDKPNSVSRHRRDDDYLSRMIVANHLKRTYVLAPGRVYRHTPVTRRGVQ